VAAKFGQMENLFKRNCHFCFFANGFTVNIRKEIFYTLSRNHYLLHTGSVGIIKTMFISNNFAIVRLTRHIPTRGKLNMTD